MQPKVQLYAIDFDISLPAVVLTAHPPVFGVSSGRKFFVPYGVSQVACDKILSTAVSLVAILEEHHLFRPRLCHLTGSGLHLPVQPDRLSGFTFGVDIAAVLAFTTNPFVFAQRPIVVADFQ